MKDIAIVLSFLLLAVAFSAIGLASGSFAAGGAAAHRVRIIVMVSAAIASLVIIRFFRKTVLSYKKQQPF